MYLGIRLGMKTVTKKRFCGSIRFSQFPLHHNKSQNCFSSVDASEMKHFSEIKDWWKSGSEMAPLYSYNFARVDFIRSFMKDFNSTRYSESTPLANTIVLDVGCGGGLLSESLCRLGGQVTGLDANSNSIEIASNHAKLDALLQASTLNYRLGTAEDLVKEQQVYDLVTCMEVIEHVSDRKAFVETLSQLVRVGGMLFMSTMEKTNESYLKLIIAAEYLLNLVPRGTHDWNKFTNASDLTQLIEEQGFRVIKVQGYSYNPITSIMEKSQSNMNYVLAAIRIR